MVKFKDFSKPLSVFQVLFKANLIFKDFSRQSCIFKYFSSLCEFKSNLVGNPKDRFLASQPIRYSPFVGKEA